MSNGVSRYQVDLIFPSHNALQPNHTYMHTYIHTYNITVGSKPTERNACIALTPERSAAELS